MSACLTETNFLRTVRIKKIVKESPMVKTFFFNDKLCSQGKPGQFIMVWLPSFDEIPMSISSTHPNGLASMTVADIGEATMLLHRKEKGDIVGVRGPFGNSFKLVKGNVLLVGGGTGIAPLIFLAEKLVKSKTGMTFLLGAKTKEELIFLSKIDSMLSKTEARIIASTEDGSHGYKGVVTELAEKTLAEKKFDMIYACGKELMLFKIFMLAEKHETPLQESMERLMRCAIGLCGSCTIGKYRVCVDGPVFTNKQLQEVKDEFGRFKRDFNGRKIPV
ncbi:MAG: dihydroorotate dehydrogenase electron transfer subunit [Candidatus Bathyarchaeota archaeon]|nr:dihydroorotate dehydrogenase electron transfer subunit [Candidatus Bathyarchaeota archaeon]MDH5494484.1 dihydroorotate dehydrogenase electron transfer subunit [Candidatus Bathyarchaeota archaeon]